MEFRVVVMVSAMMIVWMMALVASADIGVISFLSPELFALLELIEQEGNVIKTSVFAGRRFYVTSFRGHNIVAVIGGESITNSAATTAILLQKFPNINRIVGSGIAGGVVSSHTRVER